MKDAHGQASRHSPLRVPIYRCDRFLLLDVSEPGERILLVRSARPDGEAAAISAMEQDTAQAKADLRDAVQRLFDGIGEGNPRIHSEDSQRIAALAEFTVLARTHVPRSNSKNIVYIPRPEAHTPTGSTVGPACQGFCPYR